ncbi:MAG TPA: sialidase family protein [Bryobacteraceae bacterium]|nr:sialidase family protein [Bryobacteraceae bacterium]
MLSLARFSFGEQASPERVSLDLGHRGSRGGPVATLPDGAMLWVCTEPEAPYLAREMWPISRLTMRRSRDGGRSWSDPQVIVRGTRDYSVLSHALRLTRRGTLVHIYVRYSGYDYETASPAKSLCEAFCQRSSDGGRTWSAPEKLPAGERYIGDVLSIEQTRTGRLVYPFAFLTSTRGQFAVSVLYSDDDGRSWTRSKSVLEAGGSGFESGASEPTVVELADGRMLMLIRAQSGFLWRSFSTDQGKTWSAAEPSRLPASNSPATALRLRSGKIAVAWNLQVDGNYARQCLVLGITADGEEFECLRELDGTDFPDHAAEPVQHTTYAYLTERPDGWIAVSYNKGTWMRHNRPSLALAADDWLHASSETIDFSDGRTGWRSINPGPNHLAAVERYAAPGDDAPGASLELEQQKGIQAPAGISRNIPLVRDGEVRIALTVVRPEACILLNDTLLTPGRIDEACLRIRFASEGGVFLAAGQPSRRERDRRTTKYSYLSQAIGPETKYPAGFAAGRRMLLTVRYHAASQTAQIAIGEGPALELPALELKTGRILGLSYLGLAAASGGVLRVRSIQIRRRTGRA